MKHQIGVSMGVPQPKTFEAYEFLKSYNGLTNPNNFRFLSWLKDAKNLLKTNPADGYILQGFAYILLGKPELAIDSMKNAKLLNNYFGKINYAGLLSRLGETQRSSEICFEILRQNPTDRQAFLIVLDNADFALNVNLVEQVGQLYKGDKEDEQIQTSFLSHINQYEKLLQKLDIDKNVFLKIRKSLVEFLPNYYYGMFTTKSFARETEIGKHLEFNVYLYDVDIEKCLDLTDLFLDKLINDEGLDFDAYKKIIVHFIPIEYNHQVA